MDKDRKIKATDAGLARLDELKGFHVADGDSDIRGWEVRTPDGNTIGKVEELIVDPAERRVRYIEVNVDRNVLGLDEDRHILVPIGAARLEDNGNNVLIERLPAQGLAGAPPYMRGPITRDYETSLRGYYGATAGPSSDDYYRNDLYDDSRFRKTGTPDMADTTNRAGGLPRLGDNEVTVPLTGDQEVIVRQPGSDQEIVIRKRTPDAGEAESR